MEMVTDNFPEFQNRIVILEQQVIEQNKTIANLQKINEDLSCTTSKVQGFLNDVSANFVDPTTGAWITIKWYDIAKIRTGLKLLFTFVKSTFKDCYNVEFSPRVTSVLEIVLG